MARTEQALNKGRQYSHQDGQGQWSQGDNDNENPNDKPFQQRRIMMLLILLLEPSQCSIKALMWKCLKKHDKFKKNIIL